MYTLLPVLTGPRHHQLGEGPDGSQWLSGFSALVAKRNNTMDFGTVHFRPVLLSASGGVRAAGWVVEKYENDRKVGVVSQLFTTRAAAKAEADRLNALEPNTDQVAL